jgi:hypothetical protein
LLKLLPCLAATTVLERCLTFISGWSKKRSCRCPRVLSRKRELQMLYLWTSCSSESSLYCQGLFSHHSTTEWQPFICLIFQPYTPCLFPFLEERVIQITEEISILEGTLTSKFPLILHSLLLIKQTIICWHHNGTRPWQCSFTCPNYPSPPLSLAKTSFSFYILSILINWYLSLLE